MVCLFVFKFYLPGAQQHPDSVPEVGEDAVTSVSPTSPPPAALTEEERQELQEELVKVRRNQGLKRSWYRESRSGVGTNLLYLKIAVLANSGEGLFISNKARLC